MRSEFTVETDGERIRLNAILPEELVLAEVLHLGNKFIYISLSIYLVENVRVLVFLLSSTMWSCQGGRKTSAPGWKPIQNVTSFTFLSGFCSSGQFVVEGSDCQTAMCCEQKKSIFCEFTSIIWEYQYMMDRSMMQAGITTLGTCCGSLFLQGPSRHGRRTTTSDFGPLGGLQPLHTARERSETTCLPHKFFFFFFFTFTTNRTVFHPTADMFGPRILARNCPQRIHVNEYVLREG